MDANIDVIPQSPLQGYTAERTLVEEALEYRRIVMSAFQKAHLTGGTPLSYVKRSPPGWPRGHMAEYLLAAVIIPPRRRPAIWRWRAVSARRACV